MQIASLTMLGWIIATVSLTWIFPLRLQPYVIISFSGIFLLIYSPISFILLGLLTIFIYILVISKVQTSMFPMIITVCTVSLLILYFKFNHRIDQTDLELILIPLGLSYYGLKLIHFSTDYWKGSIQNVTIRQFFTYMFFLPTLMVGPINRFQAFQRNLRRRRWDPLAFSQGCERILYGYAKIVIIANYLVSYKLLWYINKFFAQQSTLSEYLHCLQYGLNVYLQFSGYSDIAIGFALLLGFSIEENFNFPFLAINISDFWRRWHITLSSWCRDYIYIGVWSLKRSSGLAVIVSMLVLGLWHELSWRFITWGIYHGFGIALWQFFQKIKPNILKPKNSWTKLIITMTAWIITMNFIILSFVITKEPDLKSAINVYFTIFHIGG